MKQIEFKPWILPLLLCFPFISINAQIEVQVNVTNGIATSTCPVVISNPMPMWSVNIDNEGWQDYPEDGNCFTAVPNVQYTANYTCPEEIPAEIQICFRAFENDPAPLVPCDIGFECLEEICQNFTIPAPGNDLAATLQLPAGLPSGGSVDFTITTTDYMGNQNDAICNAIDLGTLANGGLVGTNLVGLYDNFCATNTNEPNPFNNNSWFNDAGVWFTFTTGPDEFGHLNMVEAVNDPDGTGNQIDIQVAIYTSSDGTCSGNLNMIASLSDNNSFDATLRLSCLEPSSTYFILIDGGSSGPDTQEGIFGLQVRNLNVPEGGDLRCEVEDLGEVPENGSVSIGPRSNFCATGSGDNVSAFISQHSVWFSFIAPPSGHVLIEGFSENEELPLGIQLALFRSSTDNCNGTYSEVASIYTEADLDETMQESCLFPGERYFILVDGSGGDARGIFNIQVTDAGDITPITDQDITLCAGESLVVGTTIYTESGSYSDTLQLFAGCDSIVNSTLTILEALTLEVTEISPAIGEGNNNAVYSVDAMGGAGNYTYEWCNGETGVQANSLVGGEQCCVSVTDDNGCMEELCFDVNFTTDIIPTFTNDLLDCNGDVDGEITFSAINGMPPYNYNWQNADNSINGSGIINFEEEVIILENLPAGDYTVQISDQFDDTTFVALVTQPEPVVVSLVETQDASCFSFCDGTIEVEGSGGTGDFQYSWSGGLPGISNPVTACAGMYTVTVTDENNCPEELSMEVGEPEEFIATASEVTAVSCFEGNDGEATVQTNGNPIAFDWDNNEDTESIAELEAGFYTVIVTNEDGCTATSTIEITEPEGPVETTIVLDQPISCSGAMDGVLRADISGPGNSFTYLWSDGQAQALAENLISGNYSVLVTNEKGCEATAEFTLGEPDEIIAEVFSKDITCLDPENGGAISLENVAGGVPPYNYSLDGVLFDNISAFAGLFPGQYEAIIQDASGCEVSYPTEILGPPEITVTLGEDIEITLGDTTRLIAFTNSPNPLFNWEPKVDSLASEDGSSIVVMPFISTAYKVTVLDTETQCRATDNILVSIDKERRVYIPNAFSPNLDGINDYFMVHGGPGIVEINTFQIFSRNGMIVHEAVNFQPETIENGWDGNFRGQPMNSGVYVYLAEITFIDGRTEIFKGDVTLIR